MTAVFYDLRCKGAYVLYFRAAFNETHNMQQCDKRYWIRSDVCTQFSSA